MIEHWFQTTHSQLWFAQMLNIYENILDENWLRWEDYSREYAPWKNSWNSSQGWQLDYPLLHWDLIVSQAASNL